MARRYWYSMTTVQLGISCEPRWIGCCVGAMGGWAWPVLLAWSGVASSCSEQAARHGHHFAPALLPRVGSGGGAAMAVAVAAASVTICSDCCMLPQLQPLSPFGAALAIGDGGAAPSSSEGNRSFLCGGARDRSALLNPSARRSG